MEKEFTWEFESLDSYLRVFCKKYGYPDEAICSLSDTLKSLCDNKEELGIFKGYIDAYSENIDQEFTKILDELYVMAERAGLWCSTLRLLYLIFLTNHLHEMYIQKNIPDEVFDGSVCDLKWKLFECHKLTGRWGILVAWWTVGFFNMKRFALGRLQFDVKPLQYSCTVNGIHLEKGTPTLNTHIPSCGPLVREEYLESYLRAVDFFADKFPDGYTVFACNSWLMHPNNRVILPKHSNILPFMNDWTPVFSKDDPENSNAWNIFGISKLPENLEDLPCDTSIQRAFSTWLKEGHNIGTSLAIMLYKNGKLLNQNEMGTVL